MYRTDLFEEAGLEMPEFQGLGTQVGQNVAAALAGQMSAEQALSTSQTVAEREMQRAGY